MRRRSGTRRTERGSAAVELPFVLGLIVIPFALLVLQLPVWVERQAAANEAASEMARALAVGSVLDPGAILDAVATSYQVPPGALTLTGMEDGGPGQPITVGVAVEIPVLRLPVFGTIGQRSWTVMHSERHPDFGALVE